MEYSQPPKGPNKRSPSRLKVVGSEALAGASAATEFDPRDHQTPEATIEIADELKRYAIDFDVKFEGYVDAEVLENAEIEDDQYATMLHRAMKFLASASPYVEADKVTAFLQHRFEQLHAQGWSTQEIEDEALLLHDSLHFVKDFIKIFGNSAFDEQQKHEFFADHQSLLWIKDGNNLEFNRFAVSVETLLLAFVKPESDKSPVELLPALSGIEPTKKELLNLQFNRLSKNVLTAAGIPHRTRQAQAKLAEKTTGMWGRYYKQRFDAKIDSDHND